MDVLWDSQPKSENTSFRCHELSLESLTKIGKLKIEWTEFLYEHLVLNTESSTLKVFWFGFAAKACPIFQ